MVITTIFVLLAVAFTFLIVGYKMGERARDSLHERDTQELVNNLLDALRYSCKCDDWDRANGHECTACRAISRYGKN